MLNAEKKQVEEFVSEFQKKIPVNEPVTVDGIEVDLLKGINRQIADQDAVKK